VICAACLAGCASRPNIADHAPLADITRLEPGIHLDIRYATSNNFTGRQLYPAALAFLLPEQAKAVARAHRYLRNTGYGLLVYDAYRPWRVTRDLWDAASEKERAQGYVADPAKGSRHNRGCAIDVGLYDLETGKEVAMPSAFDEFKTQAHADWPSGSEEARHHREVLRRAMKSQGFSVLATEWWHFDYRGCDREPLLDIPLERVVPHGVGAETGIAVGP
jgi:D-alanyl-D-alanine dipeptidase